MLDATCRNAEGRGGEVLPASGEDVKTPEPLAPDRANPAAVLFSGSDSGDWPREDRVTVADTAREGDAMIGPGVTGAGTTCADTERLMGFPAAVEIESSTGLRFWSARAADSGGDVFTFEGSAPWARRPASPRPRTSASAGVV
jgi:hypothetical protein